MKRIIFLTLVLLFMFVSLFTASGVTVDGDNQGVEWDGAKTYMLFSGESNSSVNFGAVKVKFAPEEYAVYLCLMFKDPMLEKGNGVAGISLSVDDSRPFVMTMSNSPCAEDVDRFDVNGAMYIDENNGGTCEVRVGIKSGLPAEIPCSVRFFDYEGNPSNYFYFTLVNEEYEQSTQLMIASDEDETETRKTTVSKTTKTTTEKTTKEKTTRKATTKRMTETKAPKTTKEKKTENQTQAATVYYYEKEVILSQVYVTQTSTEQPTTTGAIQSETSQTEVSEETTRISLSDGNRYKTIAGVVCATAFIAVASWSVVGARRDK